MALFARYTHGTSMRSDVCSRSRYPESVGILIAHRDARCLQPNPPYCRGRKGLTRVLDPVPPIQPLRKSRLLTHTKTRLRQSIGISGTLPGARRRNRFRDIGNDRARHREKPFRDIRNTNARHRGNAFRDIRNLIGISGTKCRDIRNESLGYQERSIGISGTHPPREDALINRPARLTGC